MGRGKGLRLRLFEHLLSRMMWDGSFSLNPLKVLLGLWESVEVKPRHPIEKNADKHKRSTGGKY